MIKLVEGSARRTLVLEGCSPQCAGMTPKLKIRIRPSGLTSQVQGDGREAQRYDWLLPCIVCESSPNLRALFEAVRQFQYSASSSFASC